MRTNRTAGLVVFGLQALAASASAQMVPYYYHPAQMYDPAFYQAAAAPKAARREAPPEGILTALFASTAKPVVKRVSAPAPLADAVPPVLPAAPAAPVVSAPAAPCASCPAPQPSGWQVYGMGGVSVLRANIANRDAFVNLTSTTAVNGANVAATNSVFRDSFSPGIELSPLVILGATNADGLGGRARFWYFHDSDERTAVNTDATGAGAAITSVLPAPFTVISSAGGAGGALPAGTGGGALAAGVAPDFLTARHDFKVWVVDLEATGRMARDEWLLTASAGVRYAELEQQYGFTRTNAGGLAGGVNFVTDAETSAARHRYQGAGPTVALEAARRLGFGGLSVYGNGRGTILLGRHQFDAQTRAVVLANALGGVIDTDTLTTGSTGTSRVVPIGELELGAQWAGDLGGVTVLARAGFQVQTWFDGGSLTTTNTNVDFYGGNFLLGLLY